MAIVNHYSCCDSDNVISTDFVQSDLCIVSYNMHGYNQGFSLVRDLINSYDPDLLMLQEHWLTPHNMYKFSTDFPGYCAYGSSAMEFTVQTGPLIGRPFGGTVTLIRNDLMPVCECINASERFVVVKSGDLVCINVYLPCCGTPDRDLLCEEILNEIWYWRSEYPTCSCIIGGDFNVDLDCTSTSRSSVSSKIKSFLKENNLIRCDLASTSNINYTYANEPLNHLSKLDYFVAEGICTMDFDILDCDNNFSDHLPIIVRCLLTPITVKSNSKKRQETKPIKRLRWDHGDLLTYYNSTGQQLEPIFYELLNIENDGFKCCDVQLIDDIYDRVVAALKSSALVAIPYRLQNFFKYWWCQELDCLKQQSIESNQLWKAAGKPRSGPIFNRRNKARRDYRLGIRKYQLGPTECYSNDLHEALMGKEGNAFWNCWNSKFEIKSKRVQLVDGVIDPEQVANNFAKHFSEACSSQSHEGARALATTYNSLRTDYVGAYHSEEFCFDTELLENILSYMKRGKAVDFYGLSVEHLQYSHPILCCVLAKLFNWFLHAGYVPSQFGISYTVPLLKCNTGYNKMLSVSDFRGISISPVLSKVFEHCILRRFSSFLTTSDNQFGFKKALGCNHAVYCVRNITNHYVSNGSTVNLCALDISKAFDRVNHHGLFVKLMRRFIPVTLLKVLEHWLSICFTYVNWNSAFSNRFKLTAGVRQGGVLSPYLFALYIDDVIQHVNSLNVGCFYRSVNTSIILYADDILLLAPSVHSLQTLLSACEAKLRQLDLAINANKSVCVRIGPRCYSKCASLVTSDGKDLVWVVTVRYLGVFITRSKHFSCSFDNAKRSFYRCFNSVFGKIGRLASEEVVLHLIKSKCMPVLLYAVEACPVNRSLQGSLEFPFTRILMKIFRTRSKEIVTECQNYFNLHTVGELIKKRKLQFLQKIVSSSNTVCNLFMSVAVRESELLAANI